MYLYTIGEQLCATKVNFVDRNNINAAMDVNCFMQNMSHVEAMGFDVYGEMMYFSDTYRRNIYRMHMIRKKPEPEVIVANTGKVRGNNKFKYI